MVSRGKKEQVPLQTEPFRFRAIVLYSGFRRASILEIISLCHPPPSVFVDSRGSLFGTFVALFALYSCA